jgi:hypothetical protein
MRALPVLQPTGHNIRHRAATLGDRKALSLFDFAENLRELCLGVKGADFGVGALGYRHNYSNLFF